MTLLIASTMMASNIGPAFASGGYSSGSDEYFNTLEVKPAKLEDGQSVEDLIKNPNQSAIYSLRRDFMLPTEGASYRIAHQPYLARVGEKISDTDKNKVNKTVDLPNFIGFEPPYWEEDFDVNYYDIVAEAQYGSQSGNAEDGLIYTGSDDYRYVANRKTIKVKHVFQDINDFDNYGPKPGENQDIYRQPSGNTGSTLQISSLEDKYIRGFVPEASSITVQLPEDVTDYVVEYRYNRAYYDVTFDTDGGTPVESRSFFYGQKIPALVSSEIPTKTGYKLVGWKANVDLEGDSSNYSAGATISDINGLKMPAIPVQFTAVWESDSSQTVNKPEEKDKYTIKIDYKNGKNKDEKTVNKGDTIGKIRNRDYKGHTFMGWKWVEKSPDSQPPVLYSLNNKVNSDATLEAIWVKNDRVDVDIYHYFLDENGNLDESQWDNPLKETLDDKRVGDITATVADKISDKWTLASLSDIGNSQDSSIGNAYAEAKNIPGFDNTYFQKIKVTDNGPNKFYFFYKPFKTRDYKVNYVDKDSNKKIANQEEVKSECQDFDVKNYRPIKGWVLDKEEKPQKQLFFNVDPKSQELEGINGTGTDEITFYYKDVRIIEVPDNTADLEGYVRVNFIAEEGGSFGQDSKGEDIKELHYYVIKGLKSDFLPVPKELEQGETQDPDKYYITADKGKNFKEWAESELLNSNVIIEEDYTFKAKFDWSGLQAKPMVRTESYKDPKDNWTNDFAPTIDQLKKQIVWMEDGQEKSLPSDATVKILDENGNELTEDGVYDKLKELGVADKNQEYRMVNLKAKVEFSDKKNTKELEIPVKVYKNRYEALTSGDKPLRLSEAEKKTEAEGGLKDILSNTAEKRYVRVTVNPSNKPDNKDSKVYYVNPNAWVDIPEIILSDADKTKLKFMNWTSDDVTKNDDGKENGVFDFDKRFKFTKDTIISPVSAEDVVEQKGNKKPDVPDSFVKVIVKTTDKATPETAFERTFWVDPLNKVEINVDKPTGKTKEKVDFPGLGEKEVDYTFKTWQKVKTGADDNNLVELSKPIDIDIGKAQYTDKVTLVEAAYSEKFAAIPIGKPIKIETLKTPKGKEITDDTLKKQISPPGDKEIKSIRVISKPDGKTIGDQPAKVVITYTDGSTQGSDENPILIPVEVHDNIIPSYDGNKPKDALDDYVKITFKAGTGGTISDEKKKAYYVSPEVEADMTSIAEKITKTPDTGYVKDDWDTSETKKLKDTFEKDTVFTFKFTKLKNIIEKTDENVKKPEGYAEVIFSTDGNGKLDGDKDKITYYVNPKAGVKIVEGIAGENEIPVPKPKANENYEFDKWLEGIVTDKVITADKHHVANFNLIDVTLTYDPNGGEGKGPAAKTVKHGTKVYLANQEKLTKENYTFLGWKLSTDKTGKIYQAGDPVVLKEDTTAIAQWQIIQHTVKFDTKGGSKIGDQKVDHGSPATKPENPTKAGFVFMGWKEKETDANNYNFDTPITKDKTLVAIWDVAVKKIDEDDPVEDQYIKVVFRKGDHGKLTLDDTDQTKPVAYKVGKDLSFEEAKEYGMKVPSIVPDKYYKKVDTNDGWDKELKLAGENIEFIAKYEPEADVIPVDPTVTDENKIQEEKPEGMVLVTFKVHDDSKLYIPKDNKYYVKRGIEVRIPTPVVLEKTIDAVFKGWEDVNVVEEAPNPNDKKIFWVKQSFSADTTIFDKNTEEIKLIIKKPLAGDKRIYIEQMSDDSSGKLELIRDGQVLETVTHEEFKRRRKLYKVFNLSNELQSGDLIRYWQETSSKKSDPITELIN